MLFKTFYDSNKSHLLYILLIIIIGIFFMRNYAFGAYYAPMRSDDGPEFSSIPSSDFAYHASNAYVLKESLENSDIPLWSRYTLSGMPFYAKPQVPAFSFTWLFLIIAPTAWLGLKWSFLFHFLLAGIGMYLFMNYYFKKNPAISFFTALIYMFNGNLNSEILVAHFNILNVYAFFPLILLFAMMALNEKNWIFHSIMAGIFSSFLILGGSPQEAIFALLFIAFFMALQAIGKNFIRKSLRLILCGAILIAVFFGVSAIKILPTLDLLKIGPRQSGFSFDALAGDGVFNLSNFHSQIFYIFGIPSVFVLLSLGTLKRKRTLFAIGLLIFAILILSKSPIIYALWKYAPFVNKMRGIYKAIFIFVFPASILAGIGIAYAAEKWRSKFSAKKLYSWLFYCAVFVLIMSSLALPFQKGQKFADLKFQLEKNQVMQFMSKDNDIFRFKVFETNGIDWGTDFYSTPLNLQDIYGYDNIWLPDYMPVFLSAANSQPAKLFGMLNMKYMASMNPLNISNFTLVRKFEECGKYSDGIEICQPRKSDGPYLYKNELFLPRAFFAEKSILAYGDAANLRDIVYYMLLNNNFHPSGTVIVSSDSAADLSADFLKKFDMVLIAGGALTPQLLENLRAISKEKILVPDFTKEERAITEKSLNDALNSLNSGISKKMPDTENFRYISSDSIEVDAAGKEGMLFLSELFSSFNGWNVFVDGKETKILKANNIMTAIYVPGGSSRIILKYEPKSFISGRNISLFTLAALLVIILHRLFRQKNNKGKNEPDTGNY